MLIPIKFGKRNEHQIRKETCMQVSKKTNNNQTVKMYDYYIAMDWSLEGVSMAYMRSNSIEPKVRDNIPAKIKIIKEYLNELKGRKILTIEETTGSQWLYVELKDSVDKIIICNPKRNRLLEEGSKTDRIDAKKLCYLLRAGLLKEVYHTDDEKYRIRKLVSAHEDLVKSEVRLKNQVSALYRAIGIRGKKERSEYKKDDDTLNFILESKTRELEILLEEKRKYEKSFKEISRKEEVINNIKRISGFGPILSVEGYGIVIDASRFKNKYKFWAYSGLVKEKRESGKTSYKRRNKLYNRKLKCIFKMATQAALIGRNDIREYYEYLLEKSYTPKDARNAVTRYLATSFYAVMKKGIKYEPYYWRKKLANKAA